MRGLAAATAEMRASVSPGRLSEGRSNASALKSPANTTATDALAAAAAAAAIRPLSNSQPSVSELGVTDDSPDGVRLSIGSQSSRSR